MRLIDADALILANVDLENCCNVVDIALAVIKSVREAPTIDVETFVRYHMDEISRTIRYQLVEVDAHKPYCPNCGEKMEKDGDEPTIDPERLRPEAEWEDGVCTACQFDLRVLTDGENGLKHWVWDEGFDYCPQCGARLKAKDGED